MRLDGAGKPVEQAFFGFDEQNAGCAPFSVTADCLACACAHMYQARRRQKLTKMVEPIFQVRVGLHSGYVGNGQYAA
ncbi:MAG: hypothetical protein ACKN9T_05515 [Candidatus Methylumidiphilus sp.]